MMEQDLREIILNVKQPLKIREFPRNGSSFDAFTSVESWCQAYDEGKALRKEETFFESMTQISNSNVPQWERERKVISMSAREFINLQKKPSDSEDLWYALNYQLAEQIPNKCKEGIDFSCFGFPNLNDDCRFWLSSKNSNTPCHQDTYGCNVVVQIFGSKSWLLLPPDTPLRTTRIPYEESSVYCKENFYAPDTEQLNALLKLHNNVYECTLNAGDVLIVPRNWWHYVEACDTSLSVNAWIPIKQDIRAQMEECIVKFLIETYVKGNKSDEMEKHILNPNQLEEIVSEETLLQTLDYLYRKSREFEHGPPASKKGRTNYYDYNYLRGDDVEILLKKYPNIKYVEQLSNDDFKNLLTKNSNRFKCGENVSSQTDSVISSIQEALINSICCPKVVKQILNEFESRYKPT